MRSEEKPYSFEELSAQLSRLYLVEEFSSNLDSPKLTSRIYRKRQSPQLVLGYFRTIPPALAPKNMKIIQYRNFNYEKILAIHLHNGMRSAYIKGKVAKEAPIGAELSESTPTLIPAFA